MPVRGLQFETLAPVAPSDPNRSDIALFAGFTPAGPLNAAEPVDDWASYNRKFGSGPCYLTSAVRAFFQEGGRKCYVVRMGQPLAFDSVYAERRKAIGELVPGFLGTPPSQPHESWLWRGVEHLYGLSDVSFVCLPDLPFLAANDPPAKRERTEPPPLQEEFVECTPAVVPPEGGTFSVLREPRCDEHGYAVWTAALSRVGWLAATRAREVTVIAAVPLPAVPEGRSAGRALVANLREQWSRPLPAGLDSAFLQLCYPWLRGPGGVALPGAMEPPDGALCGLLARSALVRGAFRSAGRQRLLGNWALAEPLRAADRNAPAGLTRTPVEDRLSIFSSFPEGVILESDRTASSQPAHQPGAVQRLICLLLRAARRTGEGLVFEPSNELLWARLRGSLETLLRRLYQLGALSGASEEQAFDVICDRRSMSQADLDAGRVIAEVRIQPALPVREIRVALLLSEGGAVTLRGAA